MIRPSTYQITDLLENRHTCRLRWFEPYQALGPEGNELSAHVTHSATVHDCVNMARLPWQANGLDHKGQDRDLLIDFIAVHWAEVDPDSLPENGQESPAQLAKRVMRDAYDNTETFGYGDIGTELAYLCMAILESTPDDLKRVEWSVHQTTVSRYDDVFELCNRTFDADDPVWRHIDIRDEYGNCHRPRTEETNTDETEHEED